MSYIQGALTIKLFNVSTDVKPSMHRDPPLRSFLEMIENDIATGCNVGGLSESVLASMRSAMIAAPVDLDERLVGDVALAARTS